LPSYLRLFLPGSFAPGTEYSTPAEPPEDERRRAACLPPASGPFCAIEALAQQHLDVGLVADPLAGCLAPRSIQIPGRNAEHHLLRRRFLERLRLLRQSDADALSADAQRSFLFGLLEQFQQPILILFEPASLFRLGSRFGEFLLNLNPA
jgi:hypothetical protein